MSTAQPRFRALVIGLFATLTAVLALVGIGGILSYTVAQRRREIGVRMAVGATGGQIMRGVLGTGGWNAYPSDCRTGPGLMATRVDPGTVLREE